MSVIDQTDAVVAQAASLLEPNEIDANPEYFRALAELCNSLRGRTADDIALTERELRELSATGVTPGTWEFKAWIHVAGIEESPNAARALAEERLGELGSIEDSEPTFEERP